MQEGYAHFFQNLFPASGCGSRVSQSLIHEVEQLMAGKVPAEVFANEVCRVVGAAAGLSADVRGDDDVGMVPEWAGGGKGFDLGDVEPRAGEVAGSESGNEGGFIHDFSPRD